jgi:signal transduction histidine kinase
MTVFDRPLRRTLLVILAILLGLYLAQWRSYLLFHTLVELFSVVVASGIFVLAWNSRRFQKTGYLLWLGMALLFVAGLDVLHTLAYRGMAVLGGIGTNEPTQLWLAGRFLLAAAWLTAPLFLKRTLRPGLALAGFSAVFSLLVISIFYVPVFPEAYDDAAGRLTSFKIWSEYVICLGFLVAAMLLWRNADRFHPTILRLLLASLLAAVASDLVFTLYTDPYGAFNVAGHYFKIVSYYFLYKAVIETGLTRPFDLLFRELKRSEEALKAANEQLENRVAARTSELKRRAVQLQVLASQLTHAEQRERRRLAQILHDHIQQLLVAAKMQATSLIANSESDTSRTTAAHLCNLLQQSIDASRSLTVELCPPVLYDSGLPAAINWLATWHLEKHHLRVAVECDQGADPADEAVRVFLFQSVRELLFNVVKHAEVDQAKVTLLTQDDLVCVKVEDAGRGFDVEEINASSNGGVGLFGVRERLEVLGGSFEINSCPGKGTSVQLTAPLQSRPARSTRGARTPRSS